MTGRHCQHHGWRPTSEGDYCRATFGNTVPGAPCGSRLLPPDGGAGSVHTRTLIEGLRSDVERLRGVLVTIAQNTDLSAETLRLIAQDHLREFGG